MTARFSTSGVAGCAGALLLLACASDTDELFSPLGPPPPEGSGGAPAIAPPTMTAAEPGVPAAPPSASTEAGPAGALPVDPAVPSPPPQAAPSAAGALEPAMDVNPARVCPAVAQPLLLDFESASAGPSQALFGDFSQALSGGTFVYPERAGGAVAAGDGGVFLSPGLASDVTAGDWHISGRVSEPAGFGLFFDCQLLDATPFVGVAFRVRGQLGLGGAIRLRVRTAGNDAAREWFIATGMAAPATFGRCFPELSQYDGTCEPASADVALTPEGRDVVVRFAELAGGRPEGAVNPAEITQIEWALPPFDVADAGAFESYDVDLHIDDIRLVQP